MSTSLFVAPAGAGKTAFVLNLARGAAHDLGRPPRVVLANRAQIRSFRQRLAGAGGTIGIRLMTFDDLYLEILQAAGQHPVRLPDPVQVRVVRATLDSVPLEYLEPLAHAPNLATALRDLWSELRLAGVTPEAFEAYAQSRTARLRDLARLYAAYYQRLDEANWADYPSLSTRALEALEQHAAIGRDWPLLLVDGIDDLSLTQIRALGLLHERAGQTVITLTGDARETEREQLFRRAAASQGGLEQALGICTEPLPEIALPARAPALKHLECTLQTGDRQRVIPNDAVRMVAAPDREGEVRAALRWIKQCVVQGGAVSRAALLARDIEPYRVVLGQVASEFGLTVSLAAGVPLASNPAVAALTALLRVAVPADGQSRSAYPWRQTIDAWRSPYFDWASIGILTGDADRLDLVARWGNVLGGPDHWRETLSALRDLAPADSADDEAPRVPDALPRGEAALQLLGSLERFMRRITPPGAGEASVRPCRDHVRWLEELIGDTTGLVIGEPHSAPDEDGERTSDDGEQAERVDIGLARRAASVAACGAASGDPVAERERLSLANRDVAALNGLKDVLRGLVWAEDALRSPEQTAQAFVDDLLGAIQAASYLPPLPEGVSGIYVGTVAQARGLPFEVVAVVGLAEGEFPATLREDSFLSDQERAELNELLGARLRLRTESTEAESFYAAVTRPGTRLLLTRPRIADNGAVWQPSPYWEDVLRHLHIKPEELSTSTLPMPSECASWPELWQVVAPVLAGASAGAGAAPWCEARRPAKAKAIRAGGRAVRARERRVSRGSPLEGDLSRWGDAWAHRLGPDHLWTVSQLETYRRCPYSYLVGRQLRLEPRNGPAEGVDARQAGTLYHRILAALYRSAGPDASLAELLGLLDTIAQPILDEAPRREGFRPTAWWQHTRDTMLRNLRNTVQALEAPPVAYVFRSAERSFGWTGSGHPALAVCDDSGDEFRLGGIIDRIDEGPGGRVRIIDYKSGGVTTHSAAALVRGEDLQIALYALAVERSLGLSPVAEGYYWSVAQAEASGLKLSTFIADGHAGPRAAAAVAVRHAWQAVQAARAGVFAPTPPRGGCPSYCPAAVYCWHYREGWV